MITTMQRVSTTLSLTGQMLVVTGVKVSQSVWGVVSPPHWVCLGPGNPEILSTNTTLYTNHLSQLHILALQYYM